MKYRENRRKFLSKKLIFNYPSKFRVLNILPNNRQLKKMYKFQMGMKNEICEFSKIEKRENKKVPVRESTMQTRLSQLFGILATKNGFCHEQQSQRIASCPISYSTNSR